MQLTLASNGQAMRCEIIPLILIRFKQELLILEQLIEHAQDLNELDKFDVWSYLIDVAPLSVW